MITQAKAQLKAADKEADKLLSKAKRCVMPPPF